MMCKFLWWKDHFFQVFFLFIHVVSPWLMGNFGDNSPKIRTLIITTSDTSQNWKINHWSKLEVPSYWVGHPVKSYLAKKVYNYNTSLHWQKFPFSQRSLASICWRYEVFAHRWEHLSLAWRCEWWWIITLETVIPSLVIISRGNRPKSSSSLRFLCIKPKEKFMLTWVTILFRPEFFFCWIRS